jgi:hypothetical protein
MITGSQATPWKIWKHPFLNHEEVAFSVGRKTEVEFLTRGDLLNHLFLELEQVVFVPSKVQNMPLEPRKSF